MRMRELVRRNTEAFERFSTAMDRHDKTIDRVVESMDGHMATFARRSDALAATSIQLLETAQRWDAKTDALIDAIADLAKEIRRLNGGPDSAAA
jgi:ABC-type transporter Mla subunit MlaD